MSQRKKKQHEAAKRQRPDRWNSHFEKKSKRYKRHLIKQPWMYPMAALNLAAIVIQSLARGCISRRLVLHSLQQMTSEEHVLMQSVYVDPDCDASEYNSYHQIAALQIQFYWRSHFWGVGTFSISPQLTIQDMAKRIQAAWRRYTDRKVFHYYKNLVLFRNIGDPVRLLRSINPSEAYLFEKSTRLHVRLRLGGVNGSFPPNIYYKVFTHGNLCDVGAFAPLDYVRRRRMMNPDESHVKKCKDEMKHSDITTLYISGRREMEVQLSAESKQELLTGAATWYHRTENNGWRPVLPHVLDSQDSDYIARESATRKIPFHHTKLVRMQEVTRRKREQKIRWLRKLYKAGLAKEHENTGVGKDENQIKKQFGEEKSSVLDDPDVLGDDYDSQADELLEWSTNLDFDAYLEDWNSTGVAALRRDLDLETKYDIV